MALKSGQHIQMIVPLPVHQNLHQRPALGKILVELDFIRSDYIFSSNEKIGRTFYRAANRAGNDRRNTWSHKKRLPEDTVSLTRVIIGLDKSGHI